MSDCSAVELPRMMPDTVFAASVGFHIINGITPGQEWSLTVDFNEPDDDGNPTLWPGWNRYRWVLHQVHVIRMFSGTGRVILQEIAPGPRVDGSGNPSGPLRGLERLKAGRAATDASQQGMGIPLIGVGDPYTFNTPLPGNWDGRLFLKGNAFDNYSATYTSIASPAPTAVTLELRYRGRISLQPLVFNGRPLAADELHPLEGPRWW